MDGNDDDDSLVVGQLEPSDLVLVRRVWVYSCVCVW